MTIRQISSIDDITSADRPFLVIEESEVYPDQLVVWSDDQEASQSIFGDFLSRYHILRDLGLANALLDHAEASSYNVFVMDSAAEVLDADIDNMMPLAVEGLDVQLFPYQQYGVRKALSLIERGTDFMFFNWGTGSGKSIAAAAGAQELILNRGEFDLALVFTLSKIKGGLARMFKTTTKLRTRIIDGTPEYRQREYAKADAHVYVLNYEKAHFDQRLLLKLIKGKRVLFVFDEVQKILVWSQGKMTHAAKGINALIRKPLRSVVWPMSASIINQDPARYWRVFQWLPEHPLGNLTTFRKEYQISGSALWTGNETVRYIGAKDVWNEKKLEEVRHRVGALIHTVRKTDPGVREMFKGIQWIPVAVDMSDSDREIYDALRDWTIELKNAGSYDEAGRLVHLMKLVCNTSEALLHTSSEIVGQMTPHTINPEHLKTERSAKFEMVFDKILEIQGQGDKVVLFTHYTNLGLFLLGKQLEKHKVRHVLHWGTGMTDKQAFEAQMKFNNDPSVTVFATSDAGTHGLNLQAARYVINYEIPQSYDDLMQRNSRIDRADSHLDGLTCYGYYCRDTVEERSFEIMEQRRELAEIVQGTREELSRTRITHLGSMTPYEELTYLLRRSLD